MATYPPRRLLGARPLPSDRRRDPRRSGFPPGGGGRWERRLQSSSDGLPQPPELVRVLQGPAPRHRHLLSRLKEKTGKIDGLMLTQPSLKTRAVMTRLKFIHQK
ncbi:uncharacterized protein LOC144332960 isoform X5 [Macaca mulatta]